MENKGINRMKTIIIYKDICRLSLAIIVVILLFAGGCATSDSKMYDLLHREGANNLAYKSVTIEDYKGEDYNISTSSVIFEDCNK